MAGDGPRILLHSGWNRYNFGDVAHTPGFLRLLEQHIPEAQVRLWMSSYPEWLSAYIGARFPWVECFAGRLGGSHGDIDPVLEEAYDWADLFVFNSGPVFNYGHELVPGGPVVTKGWRGFDWNATMPHAAKLYYARSKGVPFGIFGQSFIHIASPADTVLAEILSAAAFLTTRETDSLRYLKQLGVEARDMGFAPDAAWAFDLQDDETVLPWLQNLGLENGQFLAMTTRYAPKGVDEIFDRDRQLVFYERVITDWVEATALPILLIPEMARTIRLNRELIYDPLPANLKQHVIIDDSMWSPEEQFWTPDQAQSVISRACCYLNADHHGTLQGMGGAGTPCVHAPQPQAGRKAWVYRDVGLGDWLFDMYADDPAKVSAALIEIQRDPDAARRKVAGAVAIVRQAHADRLLSIRGLLGL